MIPIAKPFIKDEEIKAVSEVLKSGMIAQGPKVKEFEQLFAKFIGVKNAVAVNSGTSAAAFCCCGVDIVAYQDKHRLPHFQINGG